MDQPNVETSNTVKIAALGRPADLGMLYDIHRNNLIVGETLWSPDELNANVTTVPHFTTNAKVLNGDSNSEKASALKIDGLLKLDVLCNFVDVEGAANCLKDENESKREVRVYLKYERKTKFRHLTMEHLKHTNISYPEILDETNATHVVVGIQYGGDVIMDFFQETNKEKGSKEVKANLKAAVDKYFASGNASVNSTTSSTTDTKKIKCRVYSDLRMDEYPSTYEEGVNLWKQLPSLTGDGVPIVLHLCPLNSLRSLLGKHHPTGKCINTEWINKVCAIIEHLESVIVECKDVVEEDNFPSLRYQITLFMEKVREYKRFFQDKISQFRERSESIDKFDGFLKEHEVSVFSRSKLTKWLDDTKNKMTTLQGIMKSLKGTPFVNSGELNALLCDTDTPHVVCLSFEPFLPEDTQLLNMQAFLDKNPTKIFEKSSWLLDITSVRKALKRFMDLSKDNKPNGVVKFVTTEEPLSSMNSSNVPGAFVQYYYEGELKIRNLMPLQRTTNLRLSYALSDYVVISWDNVFTLLNDIEDTVQYKPVNATEWQTLPVSCQQVRTTASIGGLRPATKYIFRIRSPGQIFLRELDEILEVETEARSVSAESVLSGIFLRTFFYLVVSFCLSGHGRMR